MPGRFDEIQGHRHNALSRIFVAEALMPSFNVSGERSMPSPHVDVNEIWTIAANISSQRSGSWTAESPSAAIR
ncbi:MULTISPECIES: hypothetical protein [Bradyrhizobium]|uniref:hypothetical protein n=1 Tax=Bradyrhizobium TaxID=374 RepID=UPI00114453B9|nr:MULTISPECIES: hypothetical protein [Bradyrhizobium]UFW51310.1 hypothetical protein BaraCB756_10105 [Bradyrhizobium arachidis]